MNHVFQHILAVNVGSSSIKFALYQAFLPMKRSLHGKIDGIGSDQCAITLSYDQDRREIIPLASPNHLSAMDWLMDWFDKQSLFPGILAVGHRVVHGMSHWEPEMVTEELLAHLHDLEPFIPDHLPVELEFIEALCRRFPVLTQIACFDTAFHNTIPREARMIALPRRYYSQGVHKYGFHGLSYAYLMEELARLDGKQAANSRVILAHLGSGASLAAVRDGKSIDTTMGFTPNSGLPMGTRSGDVEAGMARYLQKADGISSDAFHRIVNKESGLLGISETSSDMRELLKRATKDNRAAEAVEHFCYQTKKAIGAYAAALGGLDTLVFSGGIGENAPAVRERICKGLDFLGLQLDHSRNAENAAIVSTDSSGVKIRVLATDEERMIAKSVLQVLDKKHAVLALHE